MPRNSLEKSIAHKSSIQRASNASWLISYSNVLLGFTAFLRFLTDLRRWEPVIEGKLKFRTVVNNQFDVKSWKLSKT